MPPPARGPPPFVAVLCLALLRPLHAASASDSRSPRPIKFDIDEERPLGTKVGEPSVQAGLKVKYPLDYKDFSFAILSSHAPYFELSAPNNSTFFVSRRIDREALCAQDVSTCCPKEGKHECVIAFEMNVNHNGITRVALAIRVVIHDTNDNSCHFETSSGIQTVSFLEGEDGGKETLRSPVDPDWDYPVLQSRIRLQPKDPRFALQVTPLFSRRMLRVELILKGALDREEQANFGFTVVADDGVQLHQCRLQLNVTVLDKNDNVPVFERPVYTRDVNETDTVPLDVMRVKAHDADKGRNAEVSYEFDRLSLSEGAKRLFRVASDSGVISLIAPLRFDTREKRHELLLLAKDHGSSRRTGSARVVINVLDVNNNKPIIQVLNVKGGQKISVPEETLPPVGVASIVVTDLDEGSNALVRCRLEHTREFAMREMYQGSFQVLSNRVFDREKTSAKSFKILCHDLGSPRRTAEKEVTVHVDDMNDHAPQFELRTYSIPVVEDNDPMRFSRSFEVLQVRARDQDIGQNAQLRYEFGNLPKGTDEMFTIDHESGMISSSGHLDRESVSLYNLTVLAIDHGKPQPRTGTTTVLVTVTDYNDHKPMFQRMHYNFFLRENVPINTLVSTLTVIDRDIGENGELQFSIRGENGIHRLPFSVSGVYSPEFHRYRVALRTTHVIDREALVVSNRGYRTAVDPVYKFYVVARDFGKTDRQSSSAEVSVHVRDENDEAPRFNYPPGNDTVVSCSYLEQVGKEILRVDAYDRDAGENGSLIYTIRSGNQLGYFGIDAEKGVIRVAKRMSGSAVGIYTVEVIVTDRGAEPRSSRVNIEIHIDNSPPTSPQATNRKLSTRAINLYIIISIVASSFVISLILLGVICFIMKRNKRRRMREAEPYDKTAAPCMPMSPGAGPTSGPLLQRNAPSGRDWENEDCSGLSTNLSERSVSNLVQRNEHGTFQTRPPPYHSVPVNIQRDHKPSQITPHSMDESRPVGTTEDRSVDPGAKPKSERFSYTPLVSSFDSPSYRPRCTPEGQPSEGCNGFALASKTASIDRKRSGQRNNYTTFPRDFNRLTDTFI